MKVIVIALIERGVILLLKNVKKERERKGEEITCERFCLLFIVETSATPILFSLRRVAMHFSRTKSSGDLSRLRVIIFQRFIHDLSYTVCGMFL